MNNTSPVDSIITKTSITIIFSHLIHNYSHKKNAPPLTKAPTHPALPIIQQPKMHNLPVATLTIFQIPNEQVAPTQTIITAGHRRGAIAELDLALNIQ